MQERQHIRYAGMVRSLASWAKVARCLVDSLTKSGALVELQETQGDRFDASVPRPPVSTEKLTRVDITVTFEEPAQYPTIFRGNCGAAIGLLVWEASTWPASWVRLAKQHLQLALVPSAYCRTGLIESGFPAERCEVLPHGFDPDIYRPAAGAGERDTVRILYIGTPARRKGLDLLLEALPASFAPSDPVDLVIKTARYPDPERRPYLIADWERAVSELQARGYRITVNDAVVSETDMAELYRSADLICQPYRGEGFCLPLLEAAACGVPFVASRYGGPLDFLAADFGWFVEPRGTTAAEGMLAHWEPGLETASMAEVSVTDVANTLANALADRRGRQHKSQAAPPCVAHLTWAAVASQLSELGRRISRQI